MALVVGVSPDESGADAVALGAVLSRLLGDGLVLVHVNPPTIDYPSRGNVDAEWEAFLLERSEATLAAARRQLAEEWGIVAAEEMTVQNWSVSNGLVDAAERVGGSIIVIGPGPGGRDSHLTLGSIAHALMHGSDIGVALAPEGYRETAPERLERLVVGFREEGEAQAALRWATDAAQRSGIAVELLTVVIRVTRIVGARIGRDPERAVMQALVEQERQAQERAMSALGTAVVGTVVQGDTAQQAMGRFPWGDGDAFIVGASSLGAIRRVFPGDTNLKLLRAATVPALILPPG